MAFFWGCNNNAVKNTTNRDSSVDTQVMQIYPRRHNNDTITRIKTKRDGDSSQKSPEDNLSSIFDDYVATYTCTPCLIDSTFTIGNDIYRMHLKHFCLMDSAIKVPQSYIYMYKLDSFVTHNFVTIVSLSRNRHEIFKGRIQKKNFEKLLYPELVDYGVLRCPSMKMTIGFLILVYSISIPLTDVGIGVKALLDSNGNVTYKKW